MHAKLSLFIFGMFFSVSLIVVGAYFGFNAAYSGNATSHTQNHIESTLSYYGALRYLEQGKPEQAKQWLEQATNTKLLLLSFMDKGYVQERDRVKKEQLFSTLFDYYDRTGWRSPSSNQSEHSVETYTLVEQMLKEHRSSSLQQSQTKDALTMKAPAVQ